MSDEIGTSINKGGDGSRDVELILDSEDRELNDKVM